MSAHRAPWTLRRRIWDRNTPRAFGGRHHTARPIYRGYDLIAEVENATLRVFVRTGINIWPGKLNR